MFFCVIILNTGRCSPRYIFLRKHFCTGLIFFCFVFTITVTPNLTMSVMLFFFYVIIFLFFTITVIPYITLDQYFFTLTPYPWSVSGSFCGAKSSLFNIEPSCKSDSFRFAESYFS